MPEMTMPERADEPLSVNEYYNIIPVQQSDPAHPLCIGVQNDQFDEPVPLVYSNDLDGGNAQFRLEELEQGGYRLRSRNSGKLVSPFGGKVYQNTLPVDEAFPADMNIEPAGHHRYRIAALRMPATQMRLSGQVPVAGQAVEMSNDDKPGMLFYFAPATHFRWLDSGETPAHPYQDATELALRALIGGLLQFGGEKISALTEIPGGSMILGVVFDLVWPPKTLDEILQEFRKDLIEDMRRLQASEATIQATNALMDTRRKYAMQYHDTRRMNIDIESLKDTAQRYADDFGAAILKLLPGVINPDGTIKTPIPDEYTSLVRSGLAVYAQGAIDHLTALQERVLLDGFDPAFVTRAYLRSSDGRYFGAGTDDVVRATTTTREPAKAMCLVNIEDGTLLHNDQIALQTPLGKQQYLSAFFGAQGPLTVVRKTRGEWETLLIQRVAGSGPLMPDDRVALVSCNGAYLSAGGDDGSELTFTASTRGDAETFVLKHAADMGRMHSGSPVALQAKNGKYISVINGGEDIAARASSVGDAEKFIIHRISVGNTLHGGNKVVIRRPSDGRFASMAPERDGKRPLVTQDAGVNANSVFTVEAKAGDVIKTGEPFTLRTDPGMLGISVGASGEITAVKTGISRLQAEIIQGAHTAAPATEPIDWIESFAKSYATNIAAMLDFLIKKRQSKIGWARNEQPRVGWRVEMNDGVVNKTLYRTLESNPNQFAKTEAWIAEIRKQYEPHLALNETFVRYRPVAVAKKFGDVRAATVAMFNRIRRDIEASSEFWRNAILPNRSEWKWKL
jgi:hypothetical protein